MTVKSTNITRVQHRMALETRWAANNHSGGVLWLTGLSGSGKSTLAFEVEKRISSDLGFSPEDRVENIRRIGEIAALFADAGSVVVTAFISPYRRDRELARQVASYQFHEVYLSAGLDVCEGRDPKGLYRKARRGEIPEFTGVSAPYEAPEHPELTIDTGELTVGESMQVLLEYAGRAFAEPSRMKVRGALGG